MTIPSPAPTSEALIVYDEAMLGHDPTGWDPERPEWTRTVQELLREQYPDKEFDKFSHPERPERLTAIVDRLRADPIPGVRWMGAELAEPPELGRAHSAAHIEYIESLTGRACWLSVDTTAVSSDSVMAAKLAAGSGIVAVEALARGEAKRAFCAVRPPGHHASAGEAMGFCLYNNVAVAATHARTLHYRRILILDWDLHHGNGTQNIFYGDADTLFIDTHCESPFYPGTGHLEETGAGAAEGLNVNIPLPGGAGNAALLKAFDDIVRPAAETFRPEFVFVSAGFDAHYLDQTFSMDESGFAHLTHRLCALADEFAGGRLVMCLEGGYNAESLAVSTHAAVSAMAGMPLPPLMVLEEDPGIPQVEAAAAFHRSQRATSTPAG